MLEAPQVPGFKSYKCLLKVVDEDDCDREGCGWRNATPVRRPDVGRAQLGLLPARRQHPYVGSGRTVRFSGLVMEIERCDDIAALEGRGHPVCQLKYFRNCN